MSDKFELCFVLRSIRAQTTKTFRCLIGKGKNTPELNDSIGSFSL